MIRVTRLGVAINILLASGTAAIAQQPEPSLMFSPAEVAAVLKALNPSVEKSEASPQRGEGTAVADTVAAEQPAANIFVSAVADFGDGHWTVWANGYRIGPDHQPPGFRVVSVQDNLVEIVVPGEQAAHFRLRPYQTWRSSHHDIIEGIVP